MPPRDRVPISPAQPCQLTPARAFAPRTIGGSKEPSAPSAQKTQLIIYCAKGKISNKHGGSSNRKKKRNADGHIYDNESVFYRPIDVQETIPYLSCHYNRSTFDVHNI